MEKRDGKGYLAFALYFCIKSKKYGKKWLTKYEHMNIITYEQINICSYKRVVG